MSDAFMSLNGSRAMSARVTVPLFGAWTGDIVLASTTPISSDVEIVIGDLTMQGHAQRMASFSGARSALIVGGKGGLRKMLPARGYASPAGVKLSTILGDAAREAGESVNVDVDQSIGPGYARRRDVAERVFRRLLGRRWWFDNAGVIQTKDRDSSPITSPFTVEYWSGSKGRFTVATESYADWMPGRTFSSPTVTTMQTISSVSYTADNDGKVRLDILTDETQDNRLHDHLRDIISDEVSDLLYAGTFEYRVAASPGLPGLSSSVDVTPTDDRMPALLRVPLAPDLGIVAAPLTGTPCRIRFANGDPSRAECVSLGSTTEHTMTVEACALLIYNVFQILTNAPATGPAGPWTGPGLQPFLMAAIVAALGAQSSPAPPGSVAQIAAAVPLAAAMATGTAPSSTSAPFNAPIAALATKTLNVSGLFPGVGIPSNG